MALHRHSPAVRRDILKARPKTFVKTIINTKPPRRVKGKGRRK